MWATRLRCPSAAACPRPDITLKDVFVGSAPFALAMLVVLIIIIAFPPIATFLVSLKL